MYRYRGSARSSLTFPRSLVLLPTEKQSWFAFLFTGPEADLQKLLIDKDALRQAMNKRHERDDLEFGEFEAVSLYRSVDLNHRGEAGS